MCTHLTVNTFRGNACPYMCANAYALCVPKAMRSRFWVRVCVLEQHALRCFPVSSCSALLFCCLTSKIHLFSFISQPDPHIAASAQCHRLKRKILHLSCPCPLICLSYHNSMLLFKLELAGKTKGLCCGFCARQIIIKWNTHQNITLSVKASS